MTAVTVVMPAHDEEAVIADAVRAVRSVPASDLALVVVANGCRDRTADVARAAAEDVQIVEIPEASKVRALNAGTANVRAYPVAFVDADVVVTGETLVELARRLTATGNAHVAAPRMEVLPSPSWWVRQHYRVWALTDYRSSGHIGSGVYMLSAAGQARLGVFPDLIADDLYVQRLFAPAERLTPADLSFTVRAPATLRSLIARNSRIAAGNRQLAARHPELASAPAGIGARALIRRVLPRPGLWAGFAVYALVYTTAHRRARRILRAGSGIAWTRDESTRNRSSGLTSGGPR
ncbi:glycosyltransferase [Microbacterium caowuchunii]|uniref:4,4'-diaponeurosporenoate glycosyltransferase n=1 Tax=Microbacterium caowuchunii TaxID=2614638 RepID=A0A5N0TD09_9MICO|nr:glycosyltransferase [Microbacterium caowuchunii]KAA9132912.1 glycosyltransferase [Microbacterium caowuchunii]